jgi:FtsH-binding integral membrane protein
MKTVSKYVPGVCNIGPAEIARRRSVGYVGLGLTVAVWVGLALVAAPANVKMVVGLPAAVAAAGFLQAAMHFCAGFGVLGVTNLTHAAGTTDTVAQASYRAKDRRTALRIGLYAGLIGLAVAMIAR